jgi:hypothetical protein
MPSINDITEYAAILTNKFARHFNLTERQAINYVERYGATQLIQQQYGVLHTLSFDDAIESIAAYCKRKGGNLG